MGKNTITNLNGFSLWKNILCFFLIVHTVMCLPPPLQKYKIDATQTTVSGLSSGGCMSIQYHVAHSKSIMGVASLAGCAYWCANNNVATALKCIDGAAYVPELVSATEYAALWNSIDDPSEMKSDKVWLFSGSNDEIVSPKAVKAAQSYYENYVPKSNIFAQYNIPAVHGWVTDGSGLSCTEFDSPFVNNCTYSTSGALLEYFYGSLNKPVKAIPDNLLPFDQSAYTILSPSAISMSNTGFVYVPTSCQNGTLCRLHICFHGCQQSYEFVQYQFIDENQMNNWAEANNIIVLYPQISATTAINPYGCWDWWGYTGSNYATKSGSQIRAVENMVNAVS